MSILRARGPSSNPENPRSTWPEWTDQRWTVADLPPFLIPADQDEAYAPSREDEAFDLGYRLARDGEEPRLALPGGQAISWSFARGVLEGRKARESRAAYSAGYQVGSISDIDEPPSEYSPHERAAYAEGWAAGRADDDRDTAAWLASEELDRLEDHFTSPIDDRDIYPLGGTT